MRIRGVINGNSYRDYPIQELNDGIIKSYLDKTINQLEKFVSLYTNSLVVRIDLPTNNSNQSISRFIESFKKRIERKYSSKMGYVLVAEHSLDKDLHYHLAIMIKKPKDHLPSTVALQILDIAKDLYKSVDGKHVWLSGHFVISNRQLSIEHRNHQKEKINTQLAAGGGLFELRIDAIKERRRHTNEAVGGFIDECVYALSYLCKVNQKQNLPKGCKGIRVSKL